MRASALKYAVLTFATTLAMAIILLMPFHAFLTVWGSSIFGHYTILRLWKEMLLGLCSLSVIYLLITDYKIRSHTLTRRMVWLILVYGTVNVLWGVVAYRHHKIDAKALGYGLIVNLRFVIFFLVTWALALRTTRLRAKWQNLILWPAVIVVVFAISQELLLPSYFLEHFGYSKFTVLPFQNIDNNSVFMRVQSTLRGANPLGAYLVVVLSVAAVRLFRSGPEKLIVRLDKQRAVLFMGAILALFFTYSRGAWLGFVMSVLCLLAARQYKRKGFSRLLVISSIAIILIVSVFVVFRHNVTFENLFFHHSQISRSPISSNHNHEALLRNGLTQVMHEPLGRGPGSAGPASVYNNHPARIAENYYIQIGQELGWVGLVLFVLINGGVGYLLWLRRSDALAISLLASLIGISLINLLSHAWADDTLAYIWWGLAGIAMSLPATDSPANIVKSSAKRPKRSRA